MIDDVRDETPQGGPPNGRGLGPGHELSDVEVGGILRFLASLVVLLVFVFLVLGFAMMYFASMKKREESAAPPRFRDRTGQFPEPRSQVTPREDLATFRNRELSVLNEYGWVDQKAGIARIPLDRAIDILSEKGLPKGKTTPPRGSRTRKQP